MRRKRVVSEIAHGAGVAKLAAAAAQPETTGVSPQTRYAKTVDGVHIAYKVIGDGSSDLVLASWALNVDALWGWERSADVLRRLASFSRVLAFDRRGTGASDHFADRSWQQSLEARMDDIRAVMDAAASERAVLVGIEDGFALAAMFAATYPERTLALIGWSASARSLWAPDYPWAISATAWDEETRDLERRWGTMELAREWSTYVFPDLASDDERVERFAQWMRATGGPSDAVALYQVDRDTDIRSLLPIIRVPTLIVHRVDDQSLSIDHGRYVAQHIPGAEFVELPGRTHGWVESLDFLEVVERFVGELRREEAELDRVLASILFTDIVGSTQTAAGLGDREWKTLVESHHAMIRGLLARYRGTEVDTAGDGFFATFDGPARAVRCARVIVEKVGELGMEVRVGVHTGEVETIAGKVGGLAVIIASRVGALAGPSEVLVSQTVKDLVAGSGLAFGDSGEHELKGVPGVWRLYALGPG
jgi:class 3 adenylate cyclase